jgi:hypothetical protein
MILLVFIVKGYLFVLLLCSLSREGAGVESTSLSGTKIRKKIQSSLFFLNISYLQPHPVDGRNEHPYNI